jgi:hypothetical protein
MPGTEYQKRHKTEQIRWEKPFQAGESFLSQRTRMALFIYPPVIPLRTHDTKINRNFEKVK